MTGLLINTVYSDEKNIDSYWESDPRPVLGLQELTVHPCTFNLHEEIKLNNVFFFFFK